MRAVLYYFKNHKKINGTLFYCFEYFIFARKSDPNVRFIIYDISPADLKNVCAIFIEKYIFKHEWLKDIVAKNSVNELYQLKVQKILVLDIHTLEKLYYFLRADIVCYSNDTHQMTRSHQKKITYYGHYQYQNYDYDVRLKFNFDIFKPLQKVKKGRLFISSRLFNYDDFEIPKELRHLKPLYKHPNNHVSNLFEQFEDVFYFHSSLDKNNRLIPECFFYQKKIYIEFNGIYNDSVYLRYKDIMDSGLDNYKLNSEDPMLGDFLS